HPGTAEAGDDRDNSRGSSGSDRTGVRPDRTADRSADRSTDHSADDGGRGPYERAAGPYARPGPGARIPRALRDRQHDEESTR
ncbi:hypothetical protein AN220_30030, partial [Streptomyces nanshensis]